MQTHRCGWRWRWVDLAKKALLCQGRETRRYMKVAVKATIAIHFYCSALWSMNCCFRDAAVSLILRGNAMLDHTHVERLFILTPDLMMHTHHNEIDPVLHNMFGQVQAQRKCEGRLIWISMSTHNIIRDSVMYWHNMFKHKYHSCIWRSVFLITKITARKQMLA